MSLRWESVKKGFNAILEYVPNRVSKSIAIRLLHDLHSILSQIVRRPDCHVSELIAPDELIVSLKAGRADSPAFYCVHPAGGSIGCYASLAAELSRVAPRQSIMAIQAPDADRIPASRQKLEKLAAFYLKALKKHQPIGPYCLGGWSSGGLVAYEMACQLLEQGEQVALLALFDTKPPSKKRVRSQENQRRQMLQFARQQGLKPHPAHNWLPTAKRLAEFLLAQMKQEHLLPPETTEKQFHRRYRLFQSHIKSASAFRPRAYSGRLDIFVPKTSKTSSASRKSGWDSLASDVVIHTVPGSHHTMLGYPHVRQLAERLSQQLGRNAT
jgi:thioesterase domain-containing protein